MKKLVKTESTPEPSQPVECREAFEKFCDLNDIYRGRHKEWHDQYELQETQLRWMGYQAAWNARATTRESGVHGYEISGNTIYIGPMRPDRIKVADIICTIDWDETYTDEAKQRRIRNAERICRGLDRE